MVDINYIGSSIFPDNISVMFAELISIVMHSDPNAKMIINNKETEIVVHINPSMGNRKQGIIDNLLFINDMRRHYRVRFSKSLALSKNISFTISTNALANFNNIN